MARYTDPAQLLTKQKAAAAAVPKKAKALHVAMVRDVETTVRIELLSGKLSRTDLRRMGHPYARRSLSRRGYRRERLKGGMALSTKVAGRNAGAGIAVPMLPINAQTNELRKSGAILRFPAPGDGQELRLAYRSPHAKYMLAEKGTKKMKPRGFKTAWRRIDTRANRELQFQLRLMILTAAATGRA